MTHSVNPPPSPSPFYGAKFNPKVRFSFKHAELTFFKWYLAYWVCVQRNTKQNQVCVIEFGQMHKQSLHVYKLVKTNSPFPLSTTTIFA